jgi:hypothetical protein
MGVDAKIHVFLRPVQNVEMSASGLGSFTPVENDAMLKKLITKP